MKRLLALVLSLCFLLGGCAQNETIQSDEKDDAEPTQSGETPAGPTFEKLELRLSELPELPQEPDESALWDAMNGLSGEEQSKLWEDFNAQQDAYRDAVQALRGEGVDATLTPSMAKYTLSTARQLFGNESEKNVVYSPANLYLALCMLSETTDGESRAQVLNLLGLENVEQARAAANALWRNLYRDSSTGKTLLANSMWLNQQFDYHEETVDTLAKDYYASTFRAAMGEKPTDEAIRAWINENTKHLLENAANGLETDPDTLMLLISTLYFKGT